MMLPLLPLQRQLGKKREEENEKWPRASNLFNSPPYPN